MKQFFLLFILISIVSIPVNAQEDLLQNLLESNRDSFAAILKNPEKFEVQIIYTQIDRDENNVPHFTEHSYQLDSEKYFYPASTVKMPAAFLALEKLNNLNIKGLDKNAVMKTGIDRDPQTKAEIDSTAENGLPSIEHYIKKIFLVSDNDAYNRLYEFLGQEYLNEALFRQDRKHSRIIHRLGPEGSPFSWEDNRHTNPIEFYKKEGLVYKQDELFSFNKNKLKLRDEVRGKAHINKKGELIEEPFDFSHKNFVALQDLQDILKTLIFPETVEVEFRYNLTEADYQFLYKAMSTFPNESDFPKYDKPDHYCKFFLFGDKPVDFEIPDNFRIFNKVGWAYGYLTDVAYIIDFENKIEFFLAANIHVNENETYNDGVYEYESIGLPFFANLGRVVYEYEQKRKREREPDLEQFRFEY